MKSSSIVAKSASLLDLICASHAPLRFSEIMRRSGLPKSSAHRIINVLIEESLLAYDDINKSYQPGHRLITWASSVLNSKDLPSIAEAELLRLNQHTGAHVCLSMLKAQTVLFLKTIDSHEPHRLAPKVGEQSPIHCTAAGKVIAAYLQPTRQQNLLDAVTLERFTEHTITSRQAFLKELQQIKKRGYASCNREEILVVSGIAAPVFDHTSNVVAAISLWNIESRQNLTTLKTFVKPLCHAAQAISQRLGQVEHH